MDDGTAYELPRDYIRELVQAIADAFRKKEKLALMLRSKLDKKFHEVVSVEGNDMIAIAYDLFDNAEADGWLHDLILAIAEEKPQNPRVKAFYKKYQKLNKKQSTSQLSDTITSGETHQQPSSNILHFSHQGKHPPAPAPHEPQMGAGPTFEKIHPQDQGNIPAPIIPVSSSTILSPSQNSQRFSFRYFRSTRRYSSAVCGSGRQSLARQAFS